MSRAMLWMAAAIAAGGCARPAQPGAAGNASARDPGAVARASGVAEVQPAVRVAFAGEGTLEARGERTPKTKLALVELSVVATTSGDVAETTVEHVFHNDTGERLEGTFRFPLPDGAIVTGLAMEIDGKMTEGELVESEKARKTYENIVDSMRDPGLLEWESGQTFRLRVFPIEAREDKRVVLRFIAPLHRAGDGLFFAFRPPADVGAEPRPRLAVTVDGRRVENAAPGPTGDVLVRVADATGDAFVERTKRGAYLVADVRPSFDGAPPPVAPARGQALVVLCDRSRSVLEARAMQARLLAMLIARLEARDRFAVIAGDVRTRTFARTVGDPPTAGALHEPTQNERGAAVAFVDGVEPDGASDLGALIAAAAVAGDQARAAGLEPVFVYLGDATATWGETKPVELGRIVRERLGSAALHVIQLGKSTDDATARAIASAAHGRILRPKSEDEAQRAAIAVVEARSARRIDDVTVVGPEGADISIQPPATLYEGDEASMAAFVPVGKQSAGAELTLSGTIGGRSFRKAVAFASATPARDVAKRWASGRIERLQSEGDAHRDAVVETSLDSGVMSRYTSFLVLESEEAYERFQIARKAKAEGSDDARVTGRDLDGADDRSATVSPDHLQPGDPEIRVHAPADAQSVVVDFPFGETKSAVYEEDPRGGSWVVRFLVDQHTPDGSYTLTVRITYADGRVEIRKVPYVVDTQAPALDVAVRRDGSRYRIIARQRLGPVDASSASSRTDARRVEVSAPDGQLFALTAVRLGEFVGTWTPRARPAAHAKLRVVAVDRARNERVTEVEMP